MRLSATLLLIVISAPAHAQNLAFHDDFNCSNQSTFGASGRYGWLANWSTDPWTTGAAGYTGAGPKVGAFGGDYGGVIDQYENFLLTGAWSNRDVALEARADTRGVGAMGLVGSYDGQSYYACLASSDLLPGCGGYNYGGGGSFLLRYQAYDTCVATAPIVSGDGLAPLGPFRVRMEIFGNSITCYFDYDDDGQFSGPSDTVVNYVDPSPLAGGTSGLFGIGTSGPPTGTAWFDDFYLFTFDADSDADGVPDDAEYGLGTSPFAVDSDGDGLPDALEIGAPAFPFDTDGDFAIDAIDVDSDGDGLSDWIESRSGPVDTDCDGLHDHRDTDSDADFWPDDQDWCPTLFGNVDDADGDELGDACDANDASIDSDNDTLRDGEETRTYGTDPTVWDTDGGGQSDGLEVAAGNDPLDPTDDQVSDSDGDGLSDNEELYTYNTNPLVADTDFDGLDDGEEVNTYGTVPSNDDTDGDGLTDGDEVLVWSSDPLEVDTDLDGLQDLPEVDLYFTDPTLADTDADTLGDGDEVFTHATDPTLWDTDGDSLSDGYEVSRDTDSDTVSDALEADDDNDGVPSIDEDVVYVDGDLLDDDTDGDSVPNYRDNDDDGDGILTRAEDTNGDGVYDEDLDQDGTPSYLDDDEEDVNRDTDGDGITDLREEEIGSDPFSPDSDVDGIGDGDEVGDPANPTDTDNDGFPDLIDTDDDGDGVPTEQELVDGEAVDTDADGLPDHLDSDRDGDGVSDGRDPSPDSRGGDGPGEEPSKPDYGFGMGCSHDAGPPFLAGWLVLALAVLGRPRRRGQVAPISRS